MMPVWECNMGEAQCCGAESETCYPGNVGNYAVNATSAQDVKTAAAWAAQNNVALSVKSTGHDFQGRSSSKDTLNIWVHNLKNATYIEDWTPTECDQGEPPRKAVQALGGDQWKDVYAVATQNEVVVVGGNAQSVGAAGGYLQGGGHGALSPRYGLAVDNLLEADIVIADGTLLTVNKCWSPDLFWAIRGGGGGTYGIVTRAVYKAHEPADNYYALRSVLFANTTSCPDCVAKVVRAYIDFAAWGHENQPGLWSGFDNFGYYENYGGITFASLFQGPEAEAKRAIQIFDDLVDQSGGDIFWAYREEGNHPTFMDWHGASTDGVGGSGFLASRLIPVENFATDESRSAIVDAIMYSGQGMLTHVAG